MLTRLPGTPSPRKKRTNSTPTRKPIDKKQILQQLVTPSGAGSNISVNSATEAPRKVTFTLMILLRTKFISAQVSLGELIQMNDKGRRSKSEEGPEPTEAETSLDMDPKLEKKVEFKSKKPGQVFKLYSSGHICSSAG
jgi:hypothetical protein